MLRFDVSETEPTTTKEEWTKYSVNGVECEKNAIYQTIVDHKFYDGTIKIEKKHHSSSHQESGSIFRLLTSDNSENISANFSLGTSDFVKKFAETSEEFKTLVAKMVQSVDMLYDAQQDHEKNSPILCDTVRDCMTFFFEKTAADMTSPYNDILYKCCTEYFVVMFNMLMLNVALQMRLKNLNQDVTLPGFNFDTSSVSEKWDDKWKIKRKSQFLKKYLSVLLRQTDILCASWVKALSSVDESSVKEVNTHTNAYKAVLNSMLQKLAEYDAELIKEQSLSDKLSSFFHFGKNDATETSSPAVKSENSKKM